MDNPTLTQILSQIPEARLKVMELTPERWTEPSWKPNLENQEELQEAANEESDHISGIQRLKRSLQQIVLHPND